MHSNFKLIDGLPGWGQNILVIKAELGEEGIVFYKSPKGGEKITLKYEQITGTDVYTDKQIIEKSKSVVARGAVGSLFGPVAAIIGGMSGIGTKKIAKTSLYYVISYTTSAGNDAIITLGADVIGCKMPDFNKELKAQINTPNSGYL